jgi:hypothetical protein
MDMDSGTITATIKRFSEISGIGRSKIYELLADHSLESIYVGGRRLILIDSYRRLIDRGRLGKQLSDTVRAALRGQK